MEKDLRPRDQLQQEIFKAGNMLLSEIVKYYTNPQDINQQEARELAKRYAINRRELWNTRESQPVVLRVRTQPWIDALVHTLEDDWSFMKDALEKDSKSHIGTKEEKERAQALKNLARLI